MNLKLITSFETVQCNVFVYKTDFEFEGEFVYIIKSIHRANGKEVIRFGTERQVRNMSDSYNIPGYKKGFKL